MEAADGTRILVSRYRPRGLSKHQETWTEWLPDLGPSADLHARFYGKRGAPVAWTAYRTAYLREMRSQAPAIEALARRIETGETITLLCSSACIHESRCHRSLLRELILDAVRPAADDLGGRDTDAKQH